MTDPTPLSPTAQAVLDAVVSQPSINTRNRAAAALRAAADQLYDSPSQDYLWEIAAELEGSND